MKRFSYGERDYAFGQAMLTLRTAIGLTQADLAERLQLPQDRASQCVAGVRRRAAGLSVRARRGGDPGLLARGASEDVAR